jgi:hypothetical protein
MRNVIFLIFILTGCSNDYPIFNPNPEYIFPLTVNNQWTYVHTYSVTNYPEPGDTFFYSDTVQWKIIGRQLIEGWNTYMLIDDYHTVYYTNLDDGFYQIAYSTFSMPHSNNSQGGEHRIRFKGKTFDNIKEFEMWIMKLGNFITTGDSLSQLDSPIYDIRKMLPYPPEIGEEWAFFTYPWYAKREITDIEEVNTESGAFTCWKTTTFYDLDNDGMFDSDFYWNDYYSGIGIPKRYFWFLVEYIDENGNYIGEGESETLMLLKDYSIIFP